MKEFNIRDGFSKKNVKETTRHIRLQLGNIDRFIDHETTENFEEFISFIETCTKHLRYITVGDK